MREAEHLKLEWEWQRKV